jgi:hypothetical protein
MTLLPKLPPHRPDAATKAAYQDRVTEFCATLLEYVQDYLRKYGARKVESDALIKKPEAGRELCRQAILKYVPASAIRRYQRKLIPVRTELRRELDRLLKRRRA